MLILSDKTINSILVGFQISYDDFGSKLLEPLSQALIDYSIGKNDSKSLIRQPPRQIFATKTGNTTLVMPASNTTTTGCKIVTLPGSGGTPKGSISIYSPEGELEGLLNAETITAFRTALTSMIAFMKCPFEKSNLKIVVFGAGKQAEWNIRLVLLMFGVWTTSITVINRSSATLDALRKRLEKPRPSYYRDAEPEWKFIAKDNTENYDAALKAALHDSDAIMGCTPSTEPLFPFSYISRKKQRFISLIGSYKPHMQEVDTETILSGTHIYVDSKEESLKEAGELIKANVTKSRLIELGELLSQDRPELSKGNMVFKCVGMGIMDIVIASGLLKIAKERNKTAFPCGTAFEDF